MKKNEKIIWISVIVIIIIFIANIYLQIVTDEKNRITRIFNTIDYKELEEIYELLSNHNSHELNHQLRTIMEQLNHLESIIQNEFNKVVYLRLLLLLFILIFIFILIIYYYQYSKIKQYQSKIREKRTQRTKLKKEIRKAIAANEFKIYAQPRYDTIVKKIVGAEILVRWQKEQTLIYPDQFIKQLEQYNLIQILDLYILEKACQKLEKWESIGKKGLILSVNQSQKNISNSNYVKEIKNVIEKYHFEKNLLEIELTENILIENKEKVKKLEKELHQLNVKIAIDDFGTGYSSYSLLNEVKIDVLKLDKKLFNHLENEKTKIIIHAIIDMTKKLKIESVAEGIENKEQVEFLETIQCNQIQGYYFSKPKPIEEFEKEI